MLPGMVVVAIVFHEESVQEGVIYRFLGVVFKQVLLGYIGLAVGVMYKHMVPGLVFRWPACGVRLVPLVLAEKFRVDIDNDTPVIKQTVVNALTN